MDYQSLHIKTVVELRALAREMKVRLPAGVNKEEIIDRLLSAEKSAAEAAPAKKPAVIPAQTPVAPKRRGRPPKADAAREAAEARPEAPAQKPRPETPEPKPAAKPAPAEKPADAPQRPTRAYGGRPATRTAQGEYRPQRYAPNPAGERQRPGNPRFGGYPAAQPRAAVPRPEAAAQPAQANEAAPAPKPEAAPRPEAGEYRAINPGASELLAAGDCGEGAGVLDIQPDGYGFLRAENCLPGPNDVYISIAQIRRFGLRNGDYVEGKTRPQREGDRYSAILYITGVNGQPPEQAASRPRFEDLVPVYPDERLRLEPEDPGRKNDLSLRLIDMLAPIGKGQRGMIVSQPKAGKTTLLKKVANAITARYPDIHLIVLLIDERPEEVTDMKRSIDGEVIYSTFDEAPENHTRVSEMVLDRAQRLVETGKDVVVLLDSITRLARAYNLVIAPTGRSLSGGLDPGALFKPKRFFGAARNIENGGSLTIIATALVETGSRMDDIIFEEFKGTGNMELHLDRKLSDRRVFPAIDILKSGTRREELLLSEDEMNGEIQVRRMLAGRQQEMYESLIDLMSKTATNAEFFGKLKGWLALYEKEGYSLGSR